MEEWINSPFRQDRDHRLVSGMAFQCDIIAFPGESYVGAHVEDTAITADEALRVEIIEKYPQVWKRFAIKKDTMRKTLGINIDDSLLPVSTIQAHFHPFLLDLPTLIATNDLVSMDKNTFYINKLLIKY